MLFVKKNNVLHLNLFNFTNTKLINKNLDINIFLTYNLNIHFYFIVQCKKLKSIKYNHYNFLTLI